MKLMILLYLKSGFEECLDIKKDGKVNHHFDLIIIQKDI